MRTQIEYSSRVKQVPWKPLYETTLRQFMITLIDKNNNQ